MRAGIAALLVALCVAFGQTASAQADPNKVLRVVFPIAETGFDPQGGSDLYSNYLNRAIFDPPYKYDHLARPYKLVPNTAAALPEISKDGLTWIIHIKPGIYFSDDPAFNGKKRELTAADYVYSWKRVIDPRMRSPVLQTFDGLFVGADVAVAKASETGKFDYDTPMPGIEVVDRYTLRLRLKEPDLRFLYALAVPNTCAVAREVVDAYGLDFGAHPVGTGPYMLGEYKRSSRIVLVANPGYRETTYVPAGPIPPESQPVAAALKGRRLPIPQRVDISVIEEGQAQWLAFLNREADLLERIPADFVDQAIVGGKLKPDLAARGIKHEILLRPNTWWTYFDMEDPVVGGYTPEKIALRRAVGMGYDQDEAIRVLLKGRAVPANGPIPPDIVGFDPALKTNAQVYDPATARALLDRFGYKDRDGDGYRETPDGKPLTLERWSTPNSAARQGDELWRKNMDAIGLRIVFKKDRLPELRKMARLGKIPMRSDGWNADYPDAENFMQLLYGPNAGQENQARFKLPEFDKLYDEARRLPDSPERTKLFNRMTELVIAYAPWRMGYHLIEDQLLQPWVKFYKPHPIKSQTWEFVDFDAPPK